MCAPSWQSRLAALCPCSVETVEYKNISFTVWDVGGQDKVGEGVPIWDPCLRRGTGRSK